MTDSSGLIDGLRGHLTLAKIRSHLVYYRFHGESTAPVSIPTPRDTADWEDEMAAVRAETNHPFSRRVRGENISVT